MVIQCFGFIFSLRRGFSKNPLPTQKGSVYPTFQIAQYWAGYEAGIHKSRSIVAKALEHELAADADRNHWKAKYISELPQMKRTIEDLRKHVSDEVWLLVTQGKEALPAPPTEPADAGGEEEMNDLSNLPDAQMTAHDVQVHGMGVIAHEELARKLAIPSSDDPGQTHHCPTCEANAKRVEELENKIAAVRREALEEAAKWHEGQAFVAASSEIAAQESGSWRAENDYCDLKHRHYEYAKAIRALLEPATEENCGNRHTH